MDHPRSHPNGGPAGLPHGLAFRRYSGRDFSRCTELSAGAWPITRLAVRDDLGMKRLLNCYTRTAVLSSTWHEVALCEGKVAGFLFGRINRRCGILHKIRMQIYMPCIALYFLLLVQRRMKDPSLFMSKFIETEGEARRSGKGFDGEVVLFVVDDAYRGRGIGRQLMNRFLAHAGESGAGVIYLYTDVESNWRFYEHYGYQLHATFNDPFVSYLRGEKLTGSVYKYRLK